MFCRAMTVDQTPYTIVRGSSMHPIQNMLLFINSNFEIYMGFISKKYQVQQCMLYMKTLTVNETLRHF